MNTLKYRRVEVLKRDGTWEKRMFDQIRKNDVFRLFDPPEEGRVEAGVPSVAMNDAHLIDGVLTVTCEEIPE